MKYWPSVHICFGSSPQRFYSEKSKKTFDNQKKKNYMIIVMVMTFLLVQMWYNLI